LLRLLVVEALVRINFHPFKPMNIQTPFTFSSVYLLGVWRFAGLRLLGLCQFQFF
jgi:hypothetical protein